MRKRTIATTLLLIRLYSKLQLASPAHPLLTDLEAKSSLFDEAAAKYVVSVA